MNLPARGRGTPTMPRPCSREQEEDSMKTAIIAASLALFGATAMPARALEKPVNISEAVKHYISDVRSGNFPSESEQY